LKRRVAHVQISKNAYSFHGNLAQDARTDKDYHEQKGDHL